MPLKLFTHPLGFLYSICEQDPSRFTLVSINDTEKLCIHYSILDHGEEICRVDYYMCRPSFSTGIVAHFRIS